MKTYEEGYQAMSAALAGVGHSEGEGAAEVAAVIARVLDGLTGNAVMGAIYAIAERIEAEAALADRLVAAA